MTFHQPSVWMLLLLLLLPLLWWGRSRGRRRSTIVFSSIEPLQQVGTTWAVRLRWVVPSLRGAALALLIQRTSSWTGLEPPAWKPSRRSWGSSWKVVKGLPGAPTT
ncbi:MAG: BatA domain-containing protein [Planctomycetota bacterium]|jgi:hypothetical protein